MLIQVQLMTRHALIENNLLAALPEQDYELLLLKLEPVTLSIGDELYRPNQAIEYIYFPTDSLISLLTLVKGHRALEVGMVGPEGMLGTPVALGVSNSPVLAVAQTTGLALRISTNDFRNEFKQSAALQREVCRYIYELMAQLTQTAACNRFHQVEARLARWLLMTRDRVRSNKFHLTQELLGNMLGVRRVGVTKAAGDLRQRKLISYYRAEIVILDGVGLEAVACPCYRIVKDIHPVAGS
jgi:CRP-like cAMP-binding protein